MKLVDHLYLVSLQNYSNVMQQVTQLYSSGASDVVEDQAGYDANLSGASMVEIDSNLVRSILLSWGSQAERAALQTLCNDLNDDKAVSPFCDILQFYIKGSGFDYAIYCTPKIDGHCESHGSEEQKKIDDVFLAFYEYYKNNYDGNDPVPYWLQYLQGITMNGNSGQLVTGDGEVVSESTAGIGYFLGLAAIVLFISNFKKF